MGKQKDRLSKKIFPYLDNPFLTINTSGLDKELTMPLNNFYNQQDAVKQIIPKEILDNPNTKDVKLLPYEKSISEKFYDWWIKTSKDKDNVLENFIEKIDPTQISSWDDHYRTMNNTNSTSYDKTLSWLNLVPALGKIKKFTDVVSGLNTANETLNENK
jgi:hypothetical protein